MNKKELSLIEEKTMQGLKDFQCATVERINFLYEGGSNRILVADEVGLGKTLIARGTIVKVAQQELAKRKSLCKVVYVCSNQNIASQNLRKLDVSGRATYDNYQDTRLSMQHLKSTEQSVNFAIKNNFIQLIPLTPQTSFKMTGGSGNVRERALMFTILKRMPQLNNYLNELETLLNINNAASWVGLVHDFENRVAECERKTKGKYPKNIVREINAYCKAYSLKSNLIKHLKTIPKQGITKESKRLIKDLRTMFARLSVGMLNPSLVIMDEFQRFKYLLDSDEESDLGILTHAFLDGENTRILLLSATPYKLYSTLEEIDENGQDEHYREFFGVMDFLFRGHEQAFHDIWRNYSLALKELQVGNSAILAVKKAAEDAMYEGVCRTERLSVMQTGDYTDSSNVRHIKISENDINSYIQMQTLLDNCEADFQLPVDYVKSCPYLMSFMNSYKVKKYIKSVMTNNPDLVKYANSNLLWIKRKTVDSYSELPPVNARLEELKLHAFSEQSEKYMWVPPTRPYYNLSGVYKNSEGFSKVLVFSSWEMVPRMIGALISYEAERRTIGNLYKKNRNLKKANAHYFAETKKRYPTSRLNFSTSYGEPKGMNLYTLIYPSKTLANLYNPIECLNKKMSLSEIEREIGKKITAKLTELKCYQGEDAGRADDRWYFLTPMIMDGIEYASDWLYSFIYKSDANDTSDDKNGKGYQAHFDELEKLLFSEDLKLGKQPEDLVETLVNMTLGGFATCIYRSNGNKATNASDISKVLINSFNSTEATAIVELAYGRRSDDSHWQNVLKYCKDGCFQAMFDEYQHMLLDSVGFADEGNQNDAVYNIMLESLNIHTATYSVDTYTAFQKSIAGSEKTRGMSMRANYAVGFSKDASDTEKNVNRKENIRNAFNSPMRPFVLATTSIGQEGLDFHYYCRKVMHWNLPSNPIDLEQREGRVNRYKCLAIRQNVAKAYGNMEFKTNIWNEMFDAATKERGDNQSELVPYWCFGKNQTVKIERIVPMYPISKDEINYERMIKVLSLYRLTLGQARQEELIEYISDQLRDENALKDLFINLSPFFKTVKI